MDDGREIDLGVKDEAGDVLELTEREIALASGNDPDVDTTFDDGREGGGRDTEDAGMDAPGADDTESGGNDAKVDDATDPSANPQAGEWVDDSVKALAEQVGIGEDLLGAMSGRDEFNRIAGILKTRVDADKGGDKGGDKEVVKDDPALIDPDAYANAGYDEDIVALAKTARAMQERLAAVVPAVQRQEAFIAQQSQVQLLSDFHAIADTMGDRYGKVSALKEGDDSDNARRKLFNAFATVMRHAEDGGQVPPMREALKQAERIAFAKEIEAEAKAELARKVKNQAGKVRKSGRSVASPAKRELPGESEDPVAAIANSPELVKFWEENQM
jgi:hypothetical protein